MKPGTQFKLKNTGINRKLKIDSSAQGTILKASNGFISFRLVQGDKILEARTTDEIFRNQFMITDENMESNSLPIPEKHFSKNYPVDFLGK